MHEKLLKLKRRSVTPRSGYVYTDPDTKVTVTAPLFDELLRRAAKHRAANGLDVPGDFALLVEDQLCRANPPGMSVPRTVADDRVDALRIPVGNVAIGPVRTSDALARTQVLLRTTMTKRLSAEAAHARAKICLDCPKNAAEPCCYSCLVESVFEPRVGRHYSNWRKFLGVCAVDRTFNKPAVYAEGFRDPDASYPDHCWKTHTNEESTT